MNLVFQLSTFEAECEGELAAVIHTREEYQLGCVIPVNGQGQEGEAVVPLTKNNSEVSGPHTARVPHLPQPSPPTRSHRPISAAAATVVHLRIAHLLS